ncbi:centromere protein V-like isoform X3 [Scylla paramamosain]
MNANDLPPSYEDAIKSPPTPHAGLAPHYTPLPPSTPRTPSAPPVSHQSRLSAYHHPLHRVHAGRPGGLVRHTGGCHCGLVRFQVMAPPVLKVVDCNCSICVKKQNKHFIVPLNQFKLVSGHDALTTYTFNTHSAKHSFCSTCGVQPFHIPSDNPNAFGITPHSLDEGTVKKIQFTKQNAKKSEKVQGRRRSKR